MFLLVIVLDAPGLSKKIRPPYKIMVPPMIITHYTVHIYDNEFSNNVLCNSIHISSQSEISKIVIKWGWYINNIKLIVLLCSSVMLRLNA